MESKKTITRAVKLPGAGQKNFYLLGPQQVGKSTLLNQHYPPSPIGKNYWVNLLESDTFRDFSANPSLLRERLGKSLLTPPTQVVIDEIQRVPQLLPEIHLMIEEMGIKFALCGSSNRKLARGNIHQLGGRASRYFMLGLTSHELGTDFDLSQILNAGYLPSAYLAENYSQILRAYIGEYLQQEIIAESAVRKLANFQDFLQIAAQHDSQLVNFTYISRSCGVSHHTVQNYYEILTDSLMGRWLPPYTKEGLKSSKAKKFYFADVGVVNALTSRGEIQVGDNPNSALAFANWVFHELSTYQEYRQADNPKFKLAFWRHGKSEVDFLIGDRVAISVKMSDSINDNHLRGLRALQKKHPSFDTRVVVCRERHPFRTDDGISVLGYAEFAQRLWDGRLTESLND